MESPALKKLQEGIDKTGRLSAVALGFSIPVSVALDNVLLFVVLLCYLAGGRYREKGIAIASNPVILAALALFGMIALATAYGPATRSEAVHYLLKYVDLLFVPAIAAFFGSARTRELGLYALAAAIGLSVLLSLSFFAGLLPQALSKPNVFGYPLAFKHNLTHSILVVYGAFLFALYATESASPRKRLVYLVLAALAAANALFMVPSRTAYLVLGALVLYAGFSWWRWRGLLWAIPAAALAATIAFSASDWARDRLDLTLQEYSASDPSVAAKPQSSVGLRLEFYRNSLAIVREHPLAGVGTGGFPGAYAEQVKGTGMSLTQNPHNEYLLLMAQTGVIGLVLFLYLLWRQWQLAPRLPVLESHLARGLVVMVAVGCLFNSFLLDHTEGLLYAWLTGLLFGGLKVDRGSAT